MHGMRAWHAVHIHGSWQCVDALRQSSEEYGHGSAFPCPCCKPLGHAHGLAFMLQAPDLMLRGVAFVLQAPAMILRGLYLCCISPEVVL